MVVKTKKKKMVEDKVSEKLKQVNKDLVKATKKLKTAISNNDFTKWEKEAPSTWTFNPVPDKTIFLTYTKTSGSIVSAIQAARKLLADCESVEEAKNIIDAL